MRKTSLPLHNDLLYQAVSELAPGEWVGLLWKAQRQRDFTMIRRIHSEAENRRRDALARARNGEGELDRDLADLDRVIEDAEQSLLNAGVEY